MSFYRLVIGMIIGIAFLFLLGIPQDNWRRTVNKCDRLCETNRQFPKVVIDLTSWPIFQCSCHGFRMPDNYLLKR